MTILFYSFVFFLSIIFFYLDQSYKKYTRFFALILIIFLTIISSFRWQVGGDWENYYEMSQNLELSNLFIFSPPFAFLIYISQKLLIGIFGVNLFITTLLFYSMYRMLKKFDINILLIFPVFISVIYFIVLMGYVRQALALGFVFLFFVYNKNNSIKAFVAFLFAVSAHVSSLIFLPLLLKNFVQKKNYIIFFLSIILVFFFIHLNYNIILTSIKIYIITDTIYISKGVNFRFFTYLIAAIFFLYYKKLFIKKYPELIFFFYYSLFVIFAYLVLLLNDSLSTVVDRLNIYNFVFYIFCISTAYEVFKIKNLHYIFITLVYFFHYFLLISWMLFGDYSIFWLNYKFIN